MNTSDRAPTTVLQKGTNQFVIAAPAASMLGYYLGNHLGLSPDIVIPTVALFMAAITTLGNLFRNLAREKGWTKYIG